MNRLEHRLLDGRLCGRRLQVLLVHVHLRPDPLPLHRLRHHGARAPCLRCSCVLAGLSQGLAVCKASTKGDLWRAARRRRTPMHRPPFPPPSPPSAQQCINLTPDKGLAGLFSSFFFGFWNLMCVRRLGRSLSRRRFLAGCASLAGAAAHPSPPLPPSSLFSPCRCGFLIPQSAIPGWWIWCYWTNPIAYTLYGTHAARLLAGRLLRARSQCSPLFRVVGAAPPTPALPALPAHRSCVSLCPLPPAPHQLQASSSRSWAT